MRCLEVFGMSVEVRRHTPSALKALSGADHHPLTRAQFMLHACQRR